MIRALSLLFVAGCAPVEPEWFSGDHTSYDPPQVVTVSAPSGMDAAAVLGGCSVWSAEGIECVLVESGADIEVAWADTYCGSDNWVAYHDYRESGSVYVYPCAESEDLVALIAHEVGHTFGIAAHVWEDCSTVEERPEGTPYVCGPAVMNEYSNGLVRETVPDHEAFLSRNRCKSVLPSDVGSCS